MKIEIGEHCFGSYASVDGVSITEIEEGLFDPKLQKDARGAILLEIMQNMDNVPAYYWKELAEMAVGSNPRYEVDTEETFHDTCEQCGNWNSNLVYNKL
jgi:hypothetical protein